MARQKLSPTQEQGAGAETDFKVNIASTLRWKATDGESRYVPGLEASVVAKTSEKLVDTTTTMKGTARRQRNSNLLESYVTDDCQLRGSETLPGQDRILFLIFSLELWL